MLSDMNQTRNNKTAEIVEEYKSSLQELTANSKPHINMLTILAEDYIEYASAIVEAVEAHLQKVRSEIKLPVLYLIDSIIKNVNRVYSNLFTKNIVQTFCDVFEKVDETTKAKMWKLRQTWNDIFPATKLFSLDLRVRNIDPAWPVSTVPPNASSKSIIHVNPKFLSMQQKTSGNTPKLPVKPTILEEQKMEAEVLKKQRELIILQKQKLLLQQHQKQLERHLIHVKPELVAPDGTLKKPILTTVPCDVSKTSENPPPVSTDTSPPTVTSEPKTQQQPSQGSGDASLQNGDIVEKEESSLAPIEDYLSVRASSPVKPRVVKNDEASSQSDADLSLITNDNKSLDNDRNQRSSSSSQQQKSSSVEQSAVQPKNSSSVSRSPSKGSSARAASSAVGSASSDKQQSTRKSSRTKSQSETSSTTSSSSSSSPHKKSSKSRKRSPDRHHHHRDDRGRHHHRRDRHHHHRQRHSTPPKPLLGLDEEEQLGGSLIVSPPQPSTNRDSRQRRDSGSSAGRKCRESSSRSPESGRDESKRRDSTSSNDEYLRAALVASTGVAVAAATSLDTKEDLDLRVLPMTSNKRSSTDLIQGSNTKKQKFDDLFGKEDVDLRLLTPTPVKPVVQPPPPTPPPPVISSDKQDSWAKFKTPSKESARLSSQMQAERRERNSQRSNKFYNKPPPDSEAMKDRRRSGRDYDRNPDRNIEIIMKQAAEQLNQGTITKSQYNKLIQEVLHMSEDQKLRAAQRKERESKIWERNDKGVRPKEHGIHPRPPGGPRWQQPWHQPWAHPPGPFQGHFRPDFPRPPLGPWQNHPRLFGGPMRPDFHRFHPATGFNPRLGPPMGPNGPLILSNGPINPMTGAPLNAMGGPMGPMPPGILPLGGHAMMQQQQPKRANAGDAKNEPWLGSLYNTEANKDMEEVSSSTNSEQLPPADPKLLEEIAKDTMRSINIDNVPREIRYYGHTGVIFMHWDDPRDIGFQNGARRISIDGKEAVVCSFNDDYREFTYEGEVHRIKLGAPTRELYIDDKWYQCYFGGQPITVELRNKKLSVKLEGPPPQVKIGTIKRTDLVVGKINLIINADIRSMVPVFLDAKPQMFNIDGKPCTLEFIDALQTVLLNGRPFKVEFGGLPKPILVMGKKHFIRFSVLPRGFRAGYVKIAGMKGEQPKELPSATAPVKKQNEAATASPNATQAVPSPIEPDSTSQDGMDHSYTSKSDLQLDVLSSVVPSAMAPSSGLSYQAEPVESPPAPAPAISLPLNLNELFQRLVETGIVSNLNETKKPEEEEKKASEIIPVSFDKPETLKIKQPAMVTALYSGIQCSSCGARFAPEMATRYSHHLDWHFRQNRKERDSSRKAHSRLWYYDVSDWIQFEEIEDLEDRAQSWFETEKQSMETEREAAEEFAEIMQPSVPTGSEEDACCQVCHEAFEQFYNDEKEEWHLRPAVCFEDKNFHPLCLEDHKRAMEDSALPLDETENADDNKDNLNDHMIDDNQETKKENDSCIQNDTKLSTEGEVAEAETVSESIPTEKIETFECKMEEFESGEQLTEEINKECKMEEIESVEQLKQEIKKDADVEMSQEKIEEIEEVKEDSSESSTLKTEVKDESINIEEEPIESELEVQDSTVESTGIDSTQVEVKSTIDGNVELETTAIPVAQSKIIINITKPIASPKESKENKEEKDLKDEKSDEEDTFLPLQPASIKPALRDRNLAVLPPVEKGEELSALCSIM